MSCRAKALYLRTRSLTDLKQDWSNIHLPFGIAHLSRSGSSAAFSVCLASALLYTHAHLALPHESDSAIHHGRRAVSAHHADVINSWALVAEKINHGNPSGVDNAVAAYGGAVAFEKAMPDRPGSLEGCMGASPLLTL